MVWPVLTWWTRFWPEMTVLTRKRPETHFLPWSTWFDPYWLGGLGLDRKWRFWPETARNSFFTLVDMVWPVLTRWNQFLWKDAVDSRKIFFWILNFFLIFWIFINNNRNKITFEKILVDPKLGYNKRNHCGLVQWFLFFVLQFFSLICSLTLCWFGIGLDDFFMPVYEDLAVSRKYFVAWLILDLAK